jgi:hypothetical protein
VRIGPGVLACAQFLLAVYGGYFGGAVGLMMMAVWSLFGVTDVRAMVAAKTLLVGSLNTVAQESPRNRTYSAACSPKWSPANTPTRS